jgi:hypothetical protein
MRDRWNRDTETMLLTNEQAETMLQSYYVAGYKVVKVEPTKGGLANSSFLVQTESGNQLHLRICVRDPSAAEKEYRLIQLIQGNVPTPRLLHCESNQRPSIHDFELGGRNSPGDNCWRIETS